MEIPKFSSPLAAVAREAFIRNKFIKNVNHQQDKYKRM